MEQVAVYRNLRAYGNTSKYWSITESHTSKTGHAQKGKLIRHSTNFGLTNILLPNPKTIATGCARIRNGHREVVAFTAGNIVTSEDIQFSPDKYIGTLTLDIQSGEFTIKQNPFLLTPAGSFRPDRTKYNLWFSDKCYVYMA